MGAGQPPPPIVSIPSKSFVADNWCADDTKLIIEARRVVARCEKAARLTTACNLTRKDREHCSAAQKRRQTV